MFKYLLEKEFKQFFRNAFLPRVVIMMPVVMMLIMPWAANLEVRNVNLTVVDNDRSPFSARLVSKASSSVYFSLVGVKDTYDRAMEDIESGSSDIIMEIPRGFERDLMREGLANVLISVNAVNSTKGILGGSYLSAIVGDFSDELRSEAGISTGGSGGNSMPVIEISPQFKFNPRMNYKVFMVPALMVMLITILCGFLPALNIVSEKETGTIEQINVSPVGKFAFILAKLIPYWVVGFVILTICFGIAFVVYGLLPAGSLLTVYLGAVVYVLAISGFGLLVSNNSSTMQQAMFLMFFFMVVFILLSGLFTPIQSMPHWAQTLTVFNPMKYFIQIMRFVYLKGSGITDLTVQFLALGVFALVSNLWAVLSYRKNS